MANMGTFTVPLDVGDPARQRFRSFEALVDTGSTHSLLPGSVLRNLGVEPDEQRPFTIATGTRIMRDIGQTWVTLEGRTRMTIVVFGDEGAWPLIGAVTLEEFGLGVDPVSRKLIPVPGLLMT